MRKTTTNALIKLSDFLKPQRTDLLDQEENIDTQIDVLAKKTQFSPTAGTTNGDHLENLREILGDPLNIILNQVLAPQGLNQIIFAFDLMTQYNSSRHIAARYAIALATRNTATIALAVAQSERLKSVPHDFNGLLQGPAGGFIAQNHQSIYEMYPADTQRVTGLRTEKITSADYRNPTKAFPTFGYIAILDPRFNYSRTESEIASTMTRAIPTIEFSKCVPYFNLNITTAASTPNDDGVVSNDMSYNKFFEGGLTDVDVNTMSGLQNSVIMGEDPTTAADGVEALIAKSGSMSTSIGMEAFTMPQSIVPMSQPNDAWGGSADGGYSSFASIDRTRPFMSVDSFSVTESPTRGASSTQRAKMTITIHDRARLREVGDLLKPATLNKVEFTVEYGWSHPQGSEIYNNVYGQLINSMRTKGTFSLSNSSYSFTDDGQVKVSLDMVCKGAESINTIDCAFTGQLAELSDVVDRSYAALALARSAAGDVINLSWIQNMTATQHINTMTLNSAGSLVSGETADAVEDWINATKTRTSPLLLREFSSTLSLLREAAQNMNKALIEDLERKVKVMTQKSYNDWPIFTHARLIQSTADMDHFADEGIIPLYNGAENDALAAGWDTGQNKYIPLSALLQLFVVHPLHNSGQYDEVQLVTYTANLNAACAAGANLGAIPIDIKNIAGRRDRSFLKVLTNEYKLNGGQYPINRFIRFVNETYIQPHMSTCYGFGGNNTGNDALNYDSTTGEMTSDAIDGADQANISKALRTYYYGESYEGDPFDPRPTTFTPIDLKVLFDVSKGDTNDIEAQTGQPSQTRFSEKTVLRIHVFDQAAGDRPGAMNVLRQNIDKGIIIPGVSKKPAGMSPQLREILLPEGFNFNDSRKICQQLATNGILEAHAWDQGAPPGGPGTPAQSLEKRQADIRARINATDRRGRPSATRPKGRELKRLQGYLEYIEVRLGNVTNSSPAQSYSLSAAPQTLIDYCAQAAPNIVYGEEGSIVQQISIKTRTNSRQASMFMRRALDGGGSDTSVSRGVPMRMMPADMGIDMLGNPNIKFMQKFFIRLGTGTSLDNLYGVSGLTHNITPDSFKTTLKLIAQSAYGVFNSLVSNIDDVKAAIDSLENKMQQDINTGLRDDRDVALSAVRVRLANLIATANEDQDATIHMLARDIDYYDELVNRVNNVFFLFSDFINVTFLEAKRWEGSGAEGGVEPEWNGDVGDTDYFDSVNAMMDVQLTSEDIRLAWLEGLITFEQGLIALSENADVPGGISPDIDPSLISEWYMWKTAIVAWINRPSGFHPSYDPVLPGCESITGAGDDGWIGVIDLGTEEWKNYIVNTNPAWSTEPSALPSHPHTTKRNEILEDVALLEVIEGFAADLADDTTADHYQGSEEADIAAAAHLDQ